MVASPTWRRTSRSTGSARSTPICAVLAGADHIPNAPDVRDHARVATRPVICRDLLLLRELPLPTQRPAASLRAESRLAAPALPPRARASRTADLLTAMDESRTPRSVCELGLRFCRLREVRVNSDAAPRVLQGRGVSARRTPAFAPRGHLCEPARETRIGWTSGVGRFINRHCLRPKVVTMHALTRLVHHCLVTFF